MDDRAARPETPPPNAGGPAGAQQGAPAPPPHFDPTAFAPPQVPAGAPAPPTCVAGTPAKPGFLASTAGKVVAGCVAAALIIGGAVTWVVLAQPGKNDRAVADGPGTSDTGNEASAADFVFDPIVAADEGTTSVRVTDAGGTKIVLTAGAPEMLITGVQPDIADAFARTVADDYAAQLQAGLERYSTVTLMECGNQMLAPGGDTCESDATYTLEHAGVYENYGTVATRTSYTLGTRDRNSLAFSTTVNLETGEQAQLTDFIDVKDAGVLRRAETALRGTANWASCSDSAADYLSNAHAFSPGDEGLLLLWEVDSTSTAACGVDRIVVPWEDGASSGVDADADARSQAERSAEPVVEDINGRWCATPESNNNQECYTIDFPNVTFPSGNVEQLSERDTSESAGGIGLFVPGAPFGTYFPAGVPIEIPDYYLGADLPDQDRIWSGQAGRMLLRE
ncbi:hypothetical protein ACXR2W_06355 [Leucobacter sp. HY1908]